MPFDLAGVVAIVVWVAISFVIGTAAYICVSLPMRRQERARLFLDLLEQGLREGRSPEQWMIAASGSRDHSIGVRFHLVAAHIEAGLGFQDAIRAVPRFLPPQIVAMLAAGEATGDLGRVLPACRHLLKDGVAQARGAVNYLIVFAVALTPLTLLVFCLLSIFVFPKLLQIMADMEVSIPLFSRFIMDHATQLAASMGAVALLAYGAGFCFLGGPRLADWVHSEFFPLADWVAFHLPWRRKRMLRDFAAMLSVLLDAHIAEEVAVRLAAESAANLVFQNRAEDVVTELQKGTSLTAALGRLDESGELRWRLTQAAHSTSGFRAALAGWMETLDAKAFRQEQAAAQVASTSLVLFHGTMVGLLVVATFQTLISIVNTGVLW